MHYCKKILVDFFLRFVFDGHKKQKIIQKSKIVVNV